MVSRIAAGVLVLVACAAPAPAAQAAASDRITDPFYKYTGATPLSAIEPGTVLKKRTVQYHMGDLQLPLQAQQLLYRSTSITGKPTVNVTSVVKPLGATGPAKLIGYGSFYDSLDPRDQPSMAISGQSNPTLGGALPNVEALMILPLLSAGYTVSIADTEGQEAAFAAGPEYGKNTLDGLRAAVSSPETNATEQTKIGLLGYSGGAIATEWAAELAPTYAPDINERLVGATMGGVLVHPDHNLRYIEGSKVWAGVMPMALVGISRAFDIDLAPYMNDYGKKLFQQKQYASIVDVLFQYPGLEFNQLTKREFSTPESIAIYREVANQLIMGSNHTPTIPLQIYQGAGGENEGTAGDTPGIGPGDGVMVAGDVRSLARQYCAAGVAIEHREFANLSHIGATSPWIDASIPWLNARFAGQPAPNNCADIAPGNPLTPVQAPTVDPPVVVDPPPPVPPKPPAPPVAPELPPVAAATPSFSPLPGASKGASTPKAARAKVTRVRSGRGYVIVRISCIGARTTSCTVRSTATASRNGRRVTVGSRTRTVRGASSSTFKVKLRTSGRRLLKQRGTLKVSLTTTQTKPSPSRRVSRASVKVR
jgi:hypothetical protein